ncbi:MAG: PQQ-binding-like beta-propeller repeat protein [Verrucomicrobiales bacterium]|nr:PQQ-binding-like beta-propeller repeat protein [Verrucomicrobiales bacterium]
MRLHWLLLAIATFPLGHLGAEDWPQFRGPGGRAVSESATPPIGFGQASNLVWQIAIPGGNSSPIVTGDRVLLTAADAGRLVTLCLSRMDGHELWRSQAPLEPLKPWDAMTPGPATPTPVTDGESVFVFFGSYGLLAYGLDGNERWRQPLSSPDLEASSSLILIGQSLIVVCDRDRDSFLEARDKRTGRSLWRVDRPQFSRSRATPYHWVHDKGEELIVPGSLSLTSYNPRTGEQNWYYHGTARVATSSPADAGNLLFSSSSNIGDNNSFSAGPNAGDFGAFGLSEGLVANLNPEPKAELPKGGNGLLAIRSCGKGDITKSHLAWMSSRSLPYSASPVFYRGRLFTIKAGGLVSAYDVKTGRPIYQDERLGKLEDSFGDFYASPVAAAGRLHLLSAEGILTVLDAAADTPVVLDQHKLGEPATATPALTGKLMIVRTAKTLRAFGAVR